MSGTSHYHVVRRRNISGQNFKNLKEDSGEESTQLRNIYNEISHFKNIEDRIVHYGNQGICVIVLLRGCPGSGKTTIANKLLNKMGIQNPNQHIFSANNYFFDPKDNSYKFNTKLLPLAYTWNRWVVNQVAAEGFSPIFIDNVHAQLWEMKDSARIAASYGYVLETLEPKTAWKFNVNELSVRSTHKISAISIKRLLDKYEGNISGNDVLDMLDLEYIESKPPVLTRYSHNAPVPENILNMLKERQSPFNSDSQILRCGTGHSSEGSKVSISRGIRNSSPQSQSCTSVSHSLRNTLIEIKRIQDVKQRIILYGQNEVSVLVLMRGCPGSGKTTLALDIAKQLNIQHTEGFIFSADNYFKNPDNGRYTFNGSDLPIAHAWTKQLIEQAVYEGRSPIFCDNTNIQLWEMVHAAKIAIKNGYVIEILEPSTEWKYDEHELAKRNQHGVSIETIKRMLENFDSISVENLFIWAKLKYKSPFYPPQKAKVDLSAPFSDALSSIFHGRSNTYQLSISKYPSTQSLNLQKLRSRKGIFEQNEIKVKKYSSNENFHSGDKTLFNNNSQKKDLDHKQLNEFSEEASREFAIRYRKSISEMGFIGWDDHSVHRNKVELNEIKSSSQTQLDGSYNCSEFNGEKVLRNSSTDLLGDYFKLLNPSSIASIPGSSSSDGETEDYDSTSDEDSCQELTDEEGTSKEETDIVGRYSEQKGSGPFQTNSTVSQIDHNESLKTETFIRDVSKFGNNNCSDNDLHNEIQPASSVVEPELSKPSCNDGTENVMTGNKFSCSDNDFELVSQMFPSVNKNSLLAIFDLCQGNTDKTIKMLQDAGQDVSEDYLNGMSVSPVESTTEPCKPPPQKKRKNKKIEPSEQAKELVELIKKCINIPGNKYREIKQPENLPTCFDTPSDSEESTDRDKVTLKFNKEFVLNLQKTFGSLMCPTMINDKVNVEVPFELAKQLHLYTIESIYNDIDQEELAYKCIEEEEEEKLEESNRLRALNDGVPKENIISLREIMDFEIAQRIALEESKSPVQQTVASMLSLQVLADRFPSLSLSILTSVFNEMNQSLHQATNLLVQNGYKQNSTSTKIAQQDIQPEEYSEKDFEKMSVEEALVFAQKHRNIAEEFYNKRKECMKKVQESRGPEKCGIAYYYLEMAKWYKDLMGRSSTSAAKALLRAHRGNNILDLHMFRISEALNILDLFIEEHKSILEGSQARKRIMFVITGRGAHSQKGKPKLKMMVKQQLISRSISFVEENPGMLKITIQKTT